MVIMNTNDEISLRKAASIFPDYISYE